MHILASAALLRENKKDIKECKNYTCWLVHMHPTLFCSRMHFWGIRAIFPIFHNGRHQFSISVYTRKTRDPIFRGVSNWEFCSRMHLWGIRAIFLIFHNGRHQFSISVNTWKARDPVRVEEACWTWNPGPVVQYSLG